MRRGRKAIEPNTPGTPAPFAGTPEPPAYLDDVGTAEYRRLVAALVEAGTIAQTDPKLIECYAINYSLLMRATIELQGQPLNMGTESGRSFINPLVGAIHNTTQKLTSIVAMLGLSPVAVAKLTVQPKPVADPLDEFVKWAKGGDGRP